MTIKSIIGSFMSFFLIIHYDVLLTTTALTADCSRLHPHQETAWRVKSCKVIRTHWTRAGFADAQTASLAARGVDHLRFYGRYHIIHFIII